MTAGEPSYWDDFFQQNLIPAVLAHVIATWERMPKPGPSALEDAISIKLYSALINAKDRNAHAFLIRYQDLEVDTDLVKETGRKDIVFFPSLQDQEIYLCLEAKRLNALISGVRRSLADEYVKEGMQRFVDGKYARFVWHGAMIGYVLDRDIDRAMKNVENNIRSRCEELRMDKNAGFLASTIRPDDPRIKETRHCRAHETAVFRIHHVFVAGENQGDAAAVPKVAKGDSHQIWRIRSEEAKGGGAKRGEVKRWAMEAKSGGGKRWVTATKSGESDLDSTESTSNRGQLTIVSSVFRGAESSIPAPIAWPCP